MPDDPLWASMLSGLRVLRIIAEQPTEAALYYNAPTLEQNMTEGVLRIRPFLECFGRHLRAEGHRRS